MVVYSRQVTSDQWPVRGLQSTLRGRAQASLIEANLARHNYAMRLELQERKILKINTRSCQQGYINKNIYD